MGLCSAATLSVDSAPWPPPRQRLLDSQSRILHNTTPRWTTHRWLGQDIQPHEGLSQAAAQPLAWVGPCRTVSKLSTFGKMGENCKRLSNCAIGKEPDKTQNQADPRRERAPCGELMGETHPHSQRRCSMLCFLNISLPAEAPQGQQVTLRGSEIIHAQAPREGEMEHQQRVRTGEVRRALHSAILSRRRETFQNKILGKREVEKRVKTRKDT